MRRFEHPRQRQLRASMVRDSANEHHDSDEKADRCGDKDGSNGHDTTRRQVRFVPQSWCDRAPDHAKGQGHVPAGSVATACRSTLAATAGHRVSRRTAPLRRIGADTPSVGHRVAHMADRTPPETNVGVGIALGIFFGAVLFAVTSNPVWIAVGLAIGAALGVTYGRISNSNSDDDSDE